jgi:hypothetical protein
MTTQTNQYPSKQEMKGGMNKMKENIRTNIATLLLVSAVFGICYYYAQSSKLNREDLLPLRQEGILSELRNLDSLASDLESGRISYAPDNTIIQSRQDKLDELRKNYPWAYSKYVQGKNN